MQPYLPSQYLKRLYNDVLNKLEVGAAASAMVVLKKAFKPDSIEAMEKHQDFAKQYRFIIPNFFKFWDALIKHREEPDAFSVLYLSKDILYHYNEISKLKGDINYISVVLFAFFQWYSTRSNLKLDETFIKVLDPKYLKGE